MFMMGVYAQGCVKSLCCLLPVLLLFSLLLLTILLVVLMQFVFATCYVYAFVRGNLPLLPSALAFVLHCLNLKTIVVVILEVCDVLPCVVYDCGCMTMSM